MKKITLALVVLVTFGSAIAKQNNSFVLEKANISNASFNLVNKANSKNQCSQACWNQLTSCLNGTAPFSFCSQQFTQCIDTCEGAGGLYHK